MKASRRVALSNSAAILERADGRVWTTVVSGKIPAERFYTRLGFRFTGETEPMPGDPSRIERIMVRD